MSRLPTLKEVLLPSAQYLDDKANDHRVFSMVLLIVTTVAGVSLWLWDWVNDPSMARNTFGLRLLIIIAALPYLMTLIRRSHRLVQALVALATIVGWEAGYLQILARLHDGVSYGLAGFMYFLLMPLLITRGQAFVANAFITLGIVIAPLLLNRIGFGPALDPAKYSVLLFPASIMVIVAEYSASHLYWIGWEYRRSLEKAAMTDALTGLANRHAFNVKLDAEIERSRRFQRPLALIMVDIDYFKQINDNHGHPAGDLVIRTVANICREAVREQDMAARIGGEEFGIILVESDLSTAMCIAERIRSRVEAASMGERRDIHVTVSLGAASLQEEATSLVKAADDALYRAKEAGRNRIDSAVPKAA